MDINNLLNQFFSGQNQDSSQPQTNNKQEGNGWLDAGKNLAQQATQGGLGGFAGGAAAGGLLALLLSNGKARKLVGNVAAYGGAAALGAMALKAYQNYQSSQGEAIPSASASSDTQGHAQQLKTNSSFGLVLIKSMIMASKVDGHIDATEQQGIFRAIEKSSLSTDEKAVLLDALNKPITLQEISENVHTPEHAAQVYLASRIAIDPDQEIEKKYLTNLASALKLPTGLVTQLEAQVQECSGRDPVSG